jgi:hypothetical protein
MPSAPSISRTPGPAASLQFVAQQREMRAGEDDDVERVAARLIAQARDRASDHRGIDRLAAQLGLGAGYKAGAAVAQHALSVGELRAEIVDIGLAHGRFGAEHADDAALRQLGRRLDRGDGADDRQVERRTNMCSAIVDAVLHAMTARRG